MSKTCTGCGETKAATEYHKKATGKDGLAAVCKSCAKVRRKAYYEANKERISAYKKAYGEKNKGRIQASNKAYYEANKERILAQHKAYNEVNKDLVTARGKAYYEANKERILDRQKTYEEANKERILDRQKAHRARRVSNSPCAIYSIFCVPEQRYYIGQTTYAHNRWRQHRNYFKSNNNPCGRDGEMQNDYNKHGPESFEYTILKELPADANEETRLEEEKNHILQFLTEGKSLYNVRNTTE